MPGEDHTLLRTRKAELIEAAAFVWDVGGVFDAAGRRFDHHQRGAPVREDGTPFSSAGLVWQVFGEAAVSALLSAGAEELAPKIAADIDGSMVRRIDEIDNGVAVVDQQHQPEFVRQFVNGRTVEVRQKDAFLVGIFDYPPAGRLVTT